MISEADCRPTQLCSIAVPGDIQGLLGLGGSLALCLRKTPHTGVRRLGACPMQFGSGTDQEVGPNLVYEWLRPGIYFGQMFPR